MGIPFTSLGESGPPLHFLHANGYPPGCYQPLLNRFSEKYQVVSMHQRPLWPDSRPAEISDWLPLTADFLRFLDDRQAGTSVVVGHSVGGIVALRAALLQPDRFQALVLIDPVLFPPSVIRTWQVIHKLGMVYQVHPLVLASRNRLRQFDDKERLFNGYRRKQVFRYMDDAALHAYIDGIACPGNSGYKLCYSVEWEMRIYVTSVWHDLDIWRNLPGLKIPLLVIRGAETDTFWVSTARRVIRKAPATRVVTVPQSTHLVALERPAEVFRAAQDFFQEIL